MGQDISKQLTDYKGKSSSVTQCVIQFTKILCKFYVPQYVISIIIIIIIVIVIIVNCKYTVCCHPVAVVILYVHKYYKN